MQCEGDIGDLPGVAEALSRKGYTELRLDGTSAPQRILECLVSRGLKIDRFEVATPSLNDIFLRVAGEPSAEGENRAAGERRAGGEGRG